MSAMVTVKAGSAARSAAMTEPTMPAPRMRAFVMPQDRLAADERGWTQIRIQKCEEERQDERIGSNLRATAPWAALVRSRRWRLPASLLRSGRVLRWGL